MTLTLDCMVRMETKHLESFGYDCQLMQGVTSLKLHSFDLHTGVHRRGPSCQIEPPMSIRSCQTSKILMIRLAIEVEYEFLYPFGTSLILLFINNQQAVQVTGAEVTSLAAWQPVNWRSCQWNRSTMWLGSH